MIPALLTINVYLCFSLFRITVQNNFWNTPSSSVADYIIRTRYLYHGGPAGDNTRQSRVLEGNNLATNRDGGPDGCCSDYRLVTVIIIFVLP